MEKIMGILENVSNKILSSRKSEFCNVEYKKYGVFLLSEKLYCQKGKIHVLVKLIAYYTQNLK